MSKFEVQDMLQDLDGGTLMEQLSHAVHEVAKSVVLHGGKRKGKVVLELNMEQIKNASQVSIQHKMIYKRLTRRGDVSETRGNETPMHVSQTGVSLTPDGQHDLVERLRNNEPAE